MVFLTDLELLLEVTELGVELCVFGHLPAARSVDLIGSGPHGGDGLHLGSGINRALLGVRTCGADRLFALAGSPERTKDLLVWQPTTALRSEDDVAPFWEPSLALGPDAVQAFETLPLGGPGERIGQEESEPGGKVLRSVADRDGSRAVRVDALGTNARGDHGDRATARPLPS